VTAPFEALETDAAYWIRTAHGGGFPVETTIAHVLLFEDRKVRIVRQYLTRAEALEAAGLRG
jgi:hypothetical protein